MGKPDTKIILSWNWNYKVDKGKVLPSSLSSTPALMVSTANCCHSFRGLWFSLIKFLQILARALATCFISHYLQPAQFQRNSKEQKFSFLVIRVHKLHRSVNNVQKSNIFVDKHAQTTKWRLSSSIGQIEDWQCCFSKTYTSHDFTFICCIAVDMWTLSFERSWCALYVEILIKTTRLCNS